MWFPEIQSGFFSLWQTNELVMSLEDDEKLILQEGLTLRAAGIGKFVMTIQALSACTGKSLS